MFFMLIRRTRRKLRFRIEIFDTLILIVCVMILCTFVKIRLSMTTCWTMTRVDNLRTNAFTYTNRELRTPLVYEYQNLSKVDRVIVHKVLQTIKNPLSFSNLTCQVLPSGTVRVATSKICSPNIIANFVGIF
ncbi:hypothetical protein PanWU01x14_153920 [Parasponia andersonii]|uniref:Uncharacterized protein n=1 Tax=Parasponia andersonii TaxID=3476 RepID=A0A2P5CH85_PARAD|nr:hypothetical protein PanWU01x14_153920 [Parasponia andersonii]